MAKNKTIENATFNVGFWKDKTKAEFMEAHKGTYTKHFAGYPDQNERAEQQLSDAWEQMFPSGKKGAEVVVMDKP